MFKLILFGHLRRRRHLGEPRRLGHFRYLLPPSISHFGPLFDRRHASQVSLTHLGIGRKGRKELYWTVNLDALIFRGDVQS